MVLVVDQQVPRAVIVEPPFELILAPRVAVVSVTLVLVGLITVGIVALGGGGGTELFVAEQ